MKGILLKWGLPALTLLAFFFLLGNRPLNEPDEGRYTEIAREMIETGDWLVPHFWYLPHLDKPPMTYWLVAASMKMFGQNEWAVRLPVALAGTSGVWAAFLLGSAMGGRRTGIWSALILLSAIFYWMMSRMLTTDMILTQFNAWAIYFLWRSWTALETQKGKFFAWHLAGWIAVAGGFMTKGPVALAIPLVSLFALVIYRRGKVAGIFWAGLFSGLVLFFALVLPWFLAVFQRVPQSAHYMILGQAAGHLLGTTIKNRTAFPGYYFPVLAVEFLPWTLLLGWLWRRGHWRSLDPKSKEAWLLLNTWAIFTFTLFSLSHAKLPAYILPIFPALAVLLAWRFFGDDRAGEFVPKPVWQTALGIAFMPPVIFPFVVLFALHDAFPLWLKCQVPVALAVLVSLFILAKKWRRETIAACSVGLVLLSLFITIAELPLFEFDFKANEPLDKVGLALQKNFQPGDAIVCWGRFPQGLPFYSGGLISQTNRPYFGHMDVTQVPFEFPGNRERLGSLYLDKIGFASLLHENHGTLILGFGTAVEDFHKKNTDIPIRLIVRYGQWAWYSKDPGALPQKAATHPSRHHFT
jgi:4-amino-4-deoxy-L-arabinose transferase-like glycosyltransferase